MQRMTKRKLRMILSKGPNDFGAWLENIPGVYGAGDTPMEAKKNLLEGLRIYIKNNNVPVWLRNKQYVVVSRYDSQSLLQYYKGVFTNSALERITGINQKQIQHYASGLKKPREAQLRKIESGLHKLADELMAIEL